MFKNLIFTVLDGVATVTLNRPEVFNALSSELIKEINQAIIQAGDDSTVRVVVITGVGDKSFCSGADLKAAFDTGMSSLGESLRQGYNPMIKAIRNIEKPVICRLNGIAAGAGMSLALACDMIIANQEAYLTELFVGIGLMPDAGSMFFLPRIIGTHRAFELCSTGRKVFMEEAIQLGIVNKAVPYTELDTEIEKLTSYYKNAATRSIGLMKNVLNQSLNSSLDEILEQEAVGQDMLGNTHDFGEGVMSFLQKRKPQFKGK